ncbi:MAG: hypothetical protein H6573_11005 [Lewinellaceae bacterium]|nr:hypothetical protein [Phaeodactylibacter sp.]MCB0612578.1 hypothetical protein [Phaeodactylibacter sp.]MCB9348020.1 hypothetical protein [Lewinellaceae bacterium]
MKQLLTIPVLCLALAVQLSGQTEIFEGLFGKEEPVFHATFTPTTEEGAVKMSFYFTHPSMDQLEVAFWVKDLGANLMANGDKQLVQGLQEFGNRQQSDIRIEGLKNLHFYAIGVDYRGTGSISRKFTTKVLEESYRYTFSEAPAPAQVAEPPVQQPKAPNPAPQPCVQPNLFVKVEPAGYCGGANRPAVLIQCDNCQGRPWQFNVEARSEFGQWQPLRIDGKRQQALGVTTRTEPLCTLDPGSYYLRVLAWGDNCANPVIETIGTSIRIPGDEPVPSLYPIATATTPKAAIPIYLPDTCIIESEAVLDGDLISGFIELDPASPCSAYNPFAKIRYVHPGYRDITIGQVALAPGEDAQFKVRLDSRDLNRGIHPLQIVVCIRPKGAEKEIPVSSFWIRAETATAYQEPGLAMATAGNEPDEKDSFTRWQEEQAVGSVDTKEGWEEEDNTILGDDFTPVNITASDPNCNQIQGLQLIYVPERPEQPLYISWLNPRCCQEDGCEYTVWAGPNPNQLSLLVKGRKPGATIRELIQGAEKSTAYYEIAVRTSNGIRKAAYVPGQGPKYGIEEVLAYHDQFKPQSGEPLVATREVNSGEGIQLSGGLAARSGGAAAPAPSANRQPSLPITDFAPCRIFRETQIIANKPIQDGDRVTIEYDFKDKAYLYSLYHLPEGASDWVIAPGTEEFQKSPSFEIQAQPHHSGKYLVLALKKDKSWGCLSAPIEESIDIQVLR